MNLSPVRNFHLIRHFSWQQHLTSSELKAHDFQVSIHFFAQVGVAGEQDMEKAGESQLRGRSFQKSLGAASICPSLT